MNYTITTIISVLAGVSLTMVKCRRAQTSCRPARWSFAYAGALLAGVIMVGLIDLKDLFHIGEFSNRIPVCGAAFLDFIYSGAVALGLALFVVYRYR